MNNQFDRLQRSNLALADERDELKRVVALHEQTIRDMIDRSSEFMRETGDMIATLEQESRQLRARNERLEQELAEANAEIDRLKDCGGAHHAKQAEQEPVGYWQGKFSQDGGAVLYEVPQASAFGYHYPNYPVYAAPQPVKQEPVMDYERINALREGEQNGAEDEYFKARPENDTPTLRRMFCQGFERGFHKGLKYTAPQPVKQEPVAWMDLHKELGQLRWAGKDIGWDLAIDAVRNRLEELYAAPVRTKDLTDDDVAKAYMECTGGDVIARCRAVIAADREKNHAG